MPITHLALAILVALIWGLNFIFVKLSLNEISPILLCATRFFLVCFPAILFIKPPATSLRLLVSYGLITFALQFSLLFIGMQVGMTPGLASLLMQLQIFFSLFLAAIFLKEIPTPSQLIGASVSFVGIGVVAFHLDSRTASIGGFILILCSAMTWGIGNLVTKKIGRVNMMALVVWGSAIAFVPLTLLALIWEGPGQMLSGLTHLTLVGFSSLLFIAYMSTWVGYGVWNWLLTRYSVGNVVPFLLLVPVFAMLTSVLFLNESFQLWKLMAGLLVITGLFINLIGGRLTYKPGNQMATDKAAD
jgi:O-acetylserine/cysteine efflux transporter